MRRRAKSARTSPSRLTLGVIVSKPGAEIVRVNLPLSNAPKTKRPEASLVALALTSSSLVTVNCAPAIGAPTVRSSVANTVPENCQGPVEGATLAGTEQAVPITKTAITATPSAKGERFTDVLSAPGRRCYTRPRLLGGV